MIDAVVYVSRCGHTYKYASTLASELGLPLFTIRQAKRKLKRNSEIIFASWVNEDKIVGYNKVSKFHIDSVIAVGIMPNDDEVISRLKDVNVLYSKVFYLRGGINKKKLKLRQRLSLKSIENRLSFKLLDNGLTKSDASALEAIIHNYDYTDLNNLSNIINYYGGTYDEYVS